MPTEISLDRVRERVLASRRYRWVAPEVVERLAGEAIPKARNAADAARRTQRRLHQVLGAYEGRLPYERALADLTVASRSPDLADLRAACARIMRRHASTKERLAILERFYAQVFEVTGPPAVLLDVACGLNPLAAPWMGLPPAARYLACDIDRQLLAFVDAFLGLAGVEHQVEARDIVVAPPTQPCAVALLLKTVPCLEQQRAGAALDVLRALRARWVVVSFPTRSLGGRGKGMATTYRRQFQRMMEGQDWSVTELAFPGELVYIVRKNEQP